ncbi:MAG TPA: hypothetical protein VES19_04840 [Candidatus Limnocylindrales bacterium]|nr:hypothetical protein [Candidatus Limnocylindrales bacterium]
MTKRLQVLLPDTELRDIQRLARSRRMTTAEWVRQALRAERDREAGKGATEKLAAVRRASTHAFPTADIEAMLGEIERGYSSTDA